MRYLEESYPTFLFYFYAFYAYVFLCFLVHALMSALAVERMSAWGDHDTMAGQQKGIGVTVVAGLERDNGWMGCNENMNITTLLMNGSVHMMGWLV